MDLDDELRRMFSNVDDQLDVRVRPDAEQTIVAGARRLRRRRLAAVTATGAAAVVAVVAIGVALALPNQEAMPPAHFPTTTTTTPTEPSVSDTEPTTPDTTAPPETPPAGEGNQTVGDDPPGEAPAPPPTEPEVNGEQLGPDGFGALRLGMDVESAMATGMVGEGAPPGTGCVSRSLLIDGQASGEVYFGDKGLQIIAPGVPVHTVNGVSVGWTIDEFVARYPDERGAAESGNAYLSVPGNPDAIYRIVFADDRISRIQLQMVDQICD